MSSINPIHLCSQSVTNLIHVLFSWGLLSDIPFYKKRWSTSSTQPHHAFKLPEISSNLSYLNFSKLSISPFKNSLKNLASLMFTYDFCCYIILNVFSLSSADVWAKHNTAILFFSRHNNMTSIQKGNYYDFEVILKVLQIL